MRDDIHENWKREHRQERRQLYNLSRLGEITRVARMNKIQRNHEG